MAVLPVDASKFAGMSEEQARTFPRRALIGESLSEAQVAQMPKMISTDSHVMEPDELWQQLPPRLRERLPIPRRQRKALTDTLGEEEIELSEAIHPEPGTWRDGLVAAISLAVVITAAVAMESSISRVGMRLRIPDVIVGGVILAAVTTLPNTVAAIYLARRGRGAATLSEAMNSNAINTVVGFLLPAALIGLGTVGAGGIAVAWWYLASAVPVLAIAWLSRGIGRSAAIAGIAGYLTFVVILVQLGT